LLTTSAVTHDVLPHHHTLRLLHAGIFGSLAFLAAGADWNSVWRPDMRAVGAALVSMTTQLERIDRHVAGSRAVANS
jgi:hypothetical protein